MSSAKNQQICLVTMPLHGAGEPLLSLFLSILMPLFRDMFVITGDFPTDSFPSIKVHIKNVTYDTSNRSKSTCRASIEYVLTQLKIAIRLVKVARKVNLILFFLGPGSLMPIVLVAKLLRKRVVLAVTGSAQENAKYVYKDRLWGKGGFVFPKIIALMEAIAHTFADCIVVESPSVISRPGINKYRNKVIAEASCFVDTELFQPRTNLADRRNLVGYIGRLSQEKGVMNFIKAIPLILQQQGDTEFLVGGDGALFPEIEQKLKTFQPEDKVDLTGWIPHDKLPDYLNQMKLAVLPSYTEGLPNLVLEMMACGTPLLATPVGGIPDVIKDGETGFLLKDNSPESIARGVIKALNHPRLNEIAANAPKVIQEKYTLKAVTAGWQRIIDDME